MRKPVGHPEIKWLWRSWGRGWNWTHPNSHLLHKDRSLLLVVPVEESLVLTPSSKSYLFCFPYPRFPSVTDFPLSLSVSSHGLHLGSFGFTPRAASSNLFLIFLPMLVDSLESPEGLTRVFWASGHLATMLSNISVLSSSSVSAGTF